MALGRLFDSRLPLASIVNKGRGDFTSPRPQEDFDSDSDFAENEKTNADGRVKAQAAANSKGKSSGNSLASSHVSKSSKKCKPVEGAGKGKGKGKGRGKGATRPSKRGRAAPRREPPIPATQDTQPEVLDPRLSVFIPGAAGDAIPTGPSSSPSHEHAADPVVCFASDTVLESKECPSTDVDNLTESQPECVVEMCTPDQDGSNSEFSFSEFILSLGPTVPQIPAVHPDTHLRPSNSISRSLKHLDRLGRQATLSSLSFYTDDTFVVDSERTFRTSPTCEGFCMDGLFCDSLYCNAYRSPNSGLISASDIDRSFERIVNDPLVMLVSEDGAYGGYQQVTGTASNHTCYVEMLRLWTNENI